MTIQRIAAAIMEAWAGFEDIPFPLYEHEAEALAKAALAAMDEKPKPAKQEALDFDPVDDLWKSEAACREAIRERVAAGGPGWEPK